MKKSRKVMAADDHEGRESDPTTGLIIQTDDQNGDQDGRQLERPKEPWKGKYLKGIVNGGLDAIITSFSLISSISATRPSADVVVLGFANLVAEAISMGLGEFVATRSQKAVAANERAVTEWDVRNESGPQQMELLHQYQALGMDNDDATTVVKIFAKYKDILADEKMVAKKGITSPDEAENPWKNGLVTFASYIVFGSAPLLSFIVLMPFTDNDKVKFLGACMLSALALVLLGVAKAKIAAQNYAFSVALTLFNGAVAAAAAYTLSSALESVAGVE